MLTDRPLQLEVLVNSPGPHDQVRVRDPFLALQRLGVDCRIHERPFRFNSCIRPHSLVIWQRPLPESRQRQWEHLQWLRQRGCLLLTEWDDHPDLFPEPVRRKLQAMQWAPLELCHGLHSSSPALVTALRRLQPLGLVLDNLVADPPPLARPKHRHQPVRVLIANQNRRAEHHSLVQQLRVWLEQSTEVQLVVIGDQELCRALPPGRVEAHPLLNYQAYRAVLASCQIALLPLLASAENDCKTPIKLLECAAESVATVSGPGLYERWASPGCSWVVTALEEVVPAAMVLACDVQRRLTLVEQAHQWVCSQWSLEGGLPWRHWLYQQLWKRRSQLDQRLVERLHRAAGLPTMTADAFVH